MKIVIIGGGAGGSGSAAKCRRLDEFAEINIYEKSSYASYSNCGLPFYFSGEIKTFNDLIVTSKASLEQKYKLNVFVKHEIIDLNTNKKSVTVKDLATNKTFEDSYDKLIIAAGAPAILPKIKGTNEAKNIFSLKTPDDITKIDDYIKANGEPKDLVVIGGGFIGVELAENFKKRGIKNVTIIDAQDQLFQTVDKDIAAWGHKILIENNINLKLSTSVQEFNNEGKEITLSDGAKIKSDLTFLTIGVKPELDIYIKNGIEIGVTGGIKTNKYQETNKPDIFAIGDLAETKTWNDEVARIALAAPASRQAVVAANRIFNVEDSYKGSHGSNSISLFKTTMAAIGKTEKQLKAQNIDYKKVIIAKTNKLGSLGGQLIWFKLLFANNGKIFGAQAVGPETTEKRISYIDIMMYANQTIYDMIEYQVAYNPVVDNSFDAINIAGRAAKAILANQYQIAYVENLKELENDGWEIIDVRTPWEVNHFGKIPNSLNIPLNKLRTNLNQLDKNKKYIIHCKTGLTSYNATLILLAHGFKNVKNLSGGYDFWSTFTKFGTIIN